MALLKKIGKGIGKGAGYIFEKAGNSIESASADYPRLSGGLGLFIFAFLAYVALTGIMPNKKAPQKIPRTREKVIYDGNINGWDIKYLEGGREGNIMILRDGGLTYKFVDRVNRTALDWNSEEDSDLGTDKLEKVVLTDTDNNAEGLEIERGDHGSSEIYKNANRKYKEMREKVREELRRQRDEKTEYFLEGLKD